MKNVFFSFMQKKKRKNNLPRKLNATDEVLFYQNTIDLLIPRASFNRLALEILHENDAGKTFTKGAVEALQESSEMYIVQAFEDALLCTQNAKRATVQVNDFQTAQAIKNNR